MNTPTATVIEAAHYGETRKALMADPIIRAMAYGVRDEQRSTLAHDGGGPRHTFMMAALREYHSRGGQIATHIGGPADAILAILWGAA